MTEYIEPNTQWRDVLDNEKIMFCSRLISIDYENSVKRKIKAIRDDFLDFRCKLPHLDKEGKFELLQAEYERSQRLGLYPLIPQDMMIWELDAMKLAHNLLLIRYRQAVEDEYIKAGVSDKSLKFVNDHLQMLIQHNLRNRK